MAGSPLNEADSSPTITSVNLDVAVEPRPNGNSLAEARDVGTV